MSKYPKSALPADLSEIIEEMNNWRFRESVQTILSPKAAERVVEPRVWMPGDHEELFVKRMKLHKVHPSPLGLTVQGFWNTFLDFDKIRRVDSHPDRTIAWSSNRYRGVVITRHRFQPSIGLTLDQRIFWWLAHSAAFFAGKCFIGSTSWRWTLYPSLPISDAFVSIPHENPLTESETRQLLASFKPGYEKHLPRKQRDGRWLAEDTGYFALLVSMNTLCQVFGSSFRIRMLTWRLWKSAHSAAYCVRSQTDIRNYYSDLTMGELLAVGEHFGISAPDEAYLHSRFAACDAHWADEE